MREPVMVPSGETVAEVLDRVTGPRRAEADQLVDLCRAVSGVDPVVWAGRIIGFGNSSFQRASGVPGEVPVLAFATGASHHTIYLAAGFGERWSELLEDLGPHRRSKVCLYVTRLSRIDLDVLGRLLERTAAAA